VVIDVKDSLSHHSDRLRRSRFMSLRVRAKRRAVIDRLKAIGVEHQPQRRQKSLELVMRMRVRVACERAATEHAPQLASPG
jgi:hypothetical protein